ncbi:MAG: insulinase family protein [Deltaproteobacteria bacterium]|nr:insulinase family protein [Deltaproteobacteria bacterium]
MEKTGEAKMMGVYPMHQYKMANGLQALLVENPISPVAAVLLHYRVGSAQEKDPERGLAHFFEHMMFRETATLQDGDFDRIVAECGGVGLNAFTSYDTTAYHVNVPADRIERVLELEADRMENLRLSPDLIDKERGAVLGELHMYQDMPSEQHWEALMEESFQTHPYRHPIIGYSRLVEAFGKEDFTQFYKRHYAPDRAVLVVVGGFPLEQVRDTIQRVFGKIPPGGGGEPPAPPEPLPAAPRRRVITHPKITSENLYTAVHAPGISHPDAPALFLLSWLLSGGQSSPFHLRLVEGGLATEASATLLDAEWGMVSPSLFLMDVSLQQGVPAERAEEELDKMIGEWLEGGIPPEEMERAVNQLRLAHYEGLQSNMRLARAIGSGVVSCGDPLFGQRMEEAARQLTPEQLRETLARYWTGRPRITVIQRPEEGKQS